MPGRAIVPERGDPAAAPAQALHAADEFVEALESVARSIHDPVAKLRYLRGSLARYDGAGRFVRSVPWSPLRRLLYRWLSLEALQDLVAAHRGPRIPLSTGVRLTISMGRTLTTGSGAALALAALLGAAYVMTRPAPAPLVTTTAHAQPPPAPDVLPAAPLEPGPRAVRPAGVWLVEKGPGWEQYSNGLRIETRSAVAGELRRFRVFRLGRGLEGPVRTRPVGLLFHTTESDIWPLEASFNESLRDSSSRLLRYIARNRLYNYLIDRFGRVYRVVEEEHKPNHAGHSIWAAGETVYLNLNHAFLGVSFETRWDGGKALPITEAQFSAGRNLAGLLRERWGIPPELCTAHGLTSVNPRKHLIGHHLDWARGFPFEAFGLPDQYNLPAPSVALFGFGYDEEFLRVLEQPWPGVREAERELAEEAARRGTSVDAVRGERRDLYDQWIAAQTRDQQAGTPAEAAEAAPAARGPRGG